MQKIKIIETGDVISLSEFFDLNPTTQFPQPPTNDALQPYGAVLVEPESKPAGAPQEVPRWAGVLALKRHAIHDGDLVLLEPSDAGDSSLYSAVLAIRSDIPAGEARDRLDVALNDAKDWLRNSPTVVDMCNSLGLTSDDADALFTWAHGQLGTV